MTRPIRWCDTCRSVCHDNGDCEHCKRGAQRVASGARPATERECRLIAIRWFEDFYALNPTAL